MVKIII
jgi:hypothetical protein